MLEGRLQAFSKLFGQDSHMNRRASLTAGVGFFIFFSFHLHAAEVSPWGRLGAWIGKYPTHEEAGHIRHLWQEPAVRKSLSTLLSQTDLKRLDTGFAAEKPIVKIDHFIVVEQCMPHNCVNAHAMVILDTENHRLWVVFYERNESLVSTRWYGWSDYTLLPRSILERFRRGHAAD
jgi:hypothetical protein